MSILLVAATDAELGALKWPGKEGCGSENEAGLFSLQQLICGVGPVASIFSLMKYLASSDHPDLIINAGIAGSFNKKIPIGSVVIPITDTFAGPSIEMQDGSFRLFRKSSKSEQDVISGFDGTFTADKGCLKNIPASITRVRGLTVERASGSERTIKELVMKFSPDIETMEGASVYMAGNYYGIPVIGIRSISNMVAPGNRDEWDIPAALNSLNNTLMNLLNSFIK